jgi:periplasmic divalent cation tolerance protein
MVMFIVVLSTAKDKAQANKIAKYLVQEKLAACVNMIEKVQSVFRWEGKVDQANEVLLIIKTQKSRLPKMIKAIKMMHSYQVPEIIALPIIGGSANYLKWVKEST